MPASVFHFKQFNVSQDRCAMKVGTDGVLLGAWADPGNARRVLDVGTGTGLIALMIAQRSGAGIDAIEIDADACSQAIENVKKSPWPDRIRVIHSSLQEFRPGYRYDLIIANPPYFLDSFAASDEARNRARQASASLTYHELLDGVVRLLNITGRFCVILPHKEGNMFRELAEQNGLFCNKMMHVRTGLEKPFKRLMMEFSRVEEEMHEQELMLHEEGRNFSEDYKKLTSGYYLAF